MKKYSKAIYTVIGLILAIIFTIFCKDTLNIQDGSNLPNTEVTNTQTNNTSNNSTIQNANKIELTKALVTKVIDGDTMWVKIDGKSYKVRFVGINCPEYTKEIEPFGKEATEYTTTLLEGKEVYLQVDITDTDSYDRLLRYVWLDPVTEINEDTIRNSLVNAKIVAEGLAQSNYYKPNITLQDYLEKIEKEAQNKKIGMWQ